MIPIVTLHRGDGAPIPREGRNRGGDVAISGTLAPVRCGTRRDHPTTAGDTGMALKGHLQHFGLGELFQTLACNRHTGTLYVSSRAGRKTIYFSTGSIAFLTSGENTSRLGEILLRRGKVDETGLAAAAELQVGTERPIGRILLEQGAITPEDLQAALRTKIEEELYEMLLWEEGDFEFVPDFRPPELLEPMQPYTQVRVDPQSVIIEGLRQLDESHVIRSRIPDTRLWISREVEELPADATLDADEAEVWRACCDPRPVTQIQSIARTTKFSALKALYRFLEEGWIRVLEFEEHQEIARRMRRHNDPEAAIELYRLLCELRGSEDAELLDETGRYLVETGRKKEGAATLRRAIECRRDQGDPAGAWEIGRVLQGITPHDLDLLSLLWTLREQAPARAVSELRSTLLTALRRANRFHDAEALLAELEESESESPEYWIDRGEIARKLGSFDRAVDFLQRGERLAQQGGDPALALEAARALHSIDPELPGIRTLIENLTRREAGARRAQRLRRGALGASALVLALIAIPVIRYESSARQLYREAIARVSPTSTADALADARRSLSTVLEEYGLSTVAGRSESALVAVDRRIAERERAERVAREAAEARDRSHRAALRSQAEELLEGAMNAEQRGEFSLARSRLDALLEGPFRSLPPDQRDAILLPLHLRTTPAGAMVSIDGVEIGASPVTHRFRPGSAPFTVSVARVGCEPLEFVHTDDGSAVRDLRLSRAPVAVGALPGWVEDPAVEIDGHRVVSCRDGRVYVLPQGRHGVSMAERVLIGGTPGHPPAQVLPLGEEIVIAGHDGRVHCVDPTGWSIRWSIIHDAPILACATSETAGVVIGDELGRVILLDPATGQERSRSAMGAPIERLDTPGQLVLAFDRLGTARTLTLPSLESVFDQRLTEPVRDVLPDGSLLLASGVRDGLLGREQWPAPTTPVTWRQGRLVYGGAREWVEIREDRAFSHPAPCRLSCPPLPLSGGTFVGDADGAIHALDRGGRTLWSIRTETPPVDLRPCSDGGVLAILRSGQLLLLEGLGP